MKYYKNKDGEVFAYEDDGSQDELIGDKTEMTAEEVEAHINPPKIEQDFTISVQNYLDETAQKTKWDNMQSARSAAGIPLEGTESDIEVAMHDDAIKLARWYLKVWAYCYAALDAVKAGERAAPESTEAFIEELPILGAE